VCDAPHHRVAVHPQKDKRGPHVCFVGPRLFLDRLHNGRRRVAVARGRFRLTRGTRADALRDPQLRDDLRICGGRGDRDCFEDVNRLDRPILNTPDCLGGGGELLPRPYHQVFRRDEPFDLAAAVLQQVGRQPAGDEGIRMRRDAVEQRARIGQQGAVADRSRQPHRPHRDAGNVDDPSDSDDGERAVAEGATAARDLRGCRPAVLDASFLKGELALDLLHAIGELAAHVPAAGGGIEDRVVRGADAARPRVCVQPPSNVRPHRSLVSAPLKHSTPFATKWAQPPGKIV